MISITDYTFQQLLDQTHAKIERRHRDYHLVSSKQTKNNHIIEISYWEIFDTFEYKQIRRRRKNSET